MIVELVRETSFSGDDWYSVCVNGKYVFGSFDKNRVEEYYNRAKNNKLDKRREVLKREEIDVPSDDKN
jgi:hypothetical protein